MNGNGARDAYWSHRVWYVLRVCSSFDGCFEFDIYLFNIFFAFYEWIKGNSLEPCELIKFDTL